MVDLLVNIVCFYGKLCCVTVISLHGSVMIMFVYTVYFFTFPFCLLSASLWLLLFPITNLCPKKLPSTLAESNPTCFAVAS